MYSRDPEGQYWQDEHGRPIVFYVVAVDDEWVTLGSESRTGRDYCEGQHHADSLEPVMTVKPWLMRAVAETGGRVTVNHHYGGPLVVGDRVHVASALGGSPMVDRDTRRPSVWTVAQIGDGPDSRFPVRLAETRGGGVQPQFELYDPIERLWHHPRTLFPAAEIKGIPDGPWVRMTARYVQGPREAAPRHATWHRNTAAAYLSDASRQIVDSVGCFVEAHALDNFYGWGHVASITYIGEGA
ncbi:hypothetical protein [Yinghuangia sp. YIM S09857]|uniref:hypothetical protein n=1 Tax=Yinghuangia sp. YIM S09857 TaxID=3436929 RepID=UPI003F53C687